MTRNIFEFNEFNYNHDDCIHHWPTFDKTAEFRTFMHYSDQDAHKEITVFGSAKPGLFYNYSDRLSGDDWRAGEQIAFKSASPKTARFFEICLNRFHHTDDVDLQHVILGCNRSNGFSYLIFGYTYTEKQLPAED